LGIAPVLKLAALLAFLYLGCTPEAKALDAGAAGGLSIVPGLGQVAEGHPLEGLGWFTAVIGSLAFSKSVHISEPVAGTQVQLLSQAAYDLWLYNIYDAYRDAHPKDGKFSDQSALENYTATFNPLNLGDLVGTPALAVWTSGFGATNGNYKRITLNRPIFFWFRRNGRRGPFPWISLPRAFDYV